MDNSKSKNIASYVIQGLVGIMFLMGAIGNLMQSEMAVAQAKVLGYQESQVFTLGVLLLVSTIIYLFPKTNILGAALLTGWLGGAVATHMIHQDPIFNSIMPVVFGIVLWVGIWLRNEKIRAAFPFN